MKTKDTMLHYHIRSPQPSTEFVEKLLNNYPALLLQDNVEGDTPLHVAAKYGHPSIAEVLIQYAKTQRQELESELGYASEMLRKRNRDEKTALYEAVRHDKTKVVEILTKERVPDCWYSANNADENPLYLAASKGNYEMVVAMLENTEEGPRRVTASHPTIMSLERGVIAQPEDTILHIHIKSSEKPSIDFVRKVVEKYSNLLLEVNAKNNTPLHIAAIYGHANIAEVLIECAKSQESGRALDMQKKKNKGGNIALHEAVRYGNTTMVEVLSKSVKKLTEDEDLEFSYPINNSSETPLYLAVKRGDYKMVSAILNSCKSLNHEGKNGMTTLHEAVMSSGNISGDSQFSILREILEVTKKSPLTKKKDQYGWTPLHYAAYYGYSHTAHTLLKSDKSAAYISDKRGMTALHLSACQGHKAIMEEIILKCEESCEKVDKKGWNVLHFAMLSLNKKDLFDLLKSPAVKSLMHETNANGNTPLHIRAAAYRDSVSLIEECNILNKQNMNVEHILEYGCPELELEIQKLSEDVGNGQYTKGIIRQRKEEDYYKVRNEQRKKYYDGLKETRSSQLLVATLIATVTFTAAFTIPGGYFSEKGLDQGTAILNRNFAFQVFIITNTLAMILSLAAVCVHFIMSFEKFQKLEKLFTFALFLTMLSMGAVVVAFVTGIYAVLKPSLWLAVTTCSLGLGFFVLVLFALAIIFFTKLPNWLRPDQGISLSMSRNGSSSL